jgi:hypothetical protein
MTDRFPDAGRDHPEFQENRESTDTPTHDEAAPHVHAQTAFMVVVDESGKSFAVLQAPDGVAVNYLPDPTSVRRACMEIVADINAKMAADYTVNSLNAQAQLDAKRSVPSDAVAEAFQKRGKKFKRSSRDDN